MKEAVDSLVTHDGAWAKVVTVETVASICW